jgi:hypothetical protein
VAIIAFFVLPDFPSNSETWLSPLEKELAEKRMEEDVGVGDLETASMGSVLATTLTDWKIWHLAFT